MTAREIPRRTRLQSSTPAADAASVLLEETGQPGHEAAQAEPVPVPRQAVSETSNAADLTLPRTSGASPYEKPFATRISAEVKKAIDDHRRATGESTVDLVDRALRLVLKIK